MPETAAQNLNLSGPPPVPLSEALSPPRVLRALESASDNVAIANSTTAGAIESTAKSLTDAAEEDQKTAAAAAAGFCQDEFRVSTHVCNSLYPALSFDQSGKQAVFWHDNRDGTWEIYGKVLPSQMGSRSIEEASLLTNTQYRPVNSGCSGFSSMYGGPTSPNGIIELSYRCSSDESSSDNNPTADVAARLAQGLLDVNVSTQTAILSTDADVDFYRLDVKTGTGVRIDTGANSGQQFTVLRVLAANVLDLGFKPTAVSDTNFVFSILSANASCESLACEFRLSCDMETSMFPDVVADSSGRFHVVWQSREKSDTGKWHIWYSQVYPKNMGPKMGCGSRKFHAQGGFAEAPSGADNSVTILVGGVVKTYVSTGDVGDYFAYGDQNMPTPTGQASGGLISRTGVHTLYLDKGVLGTRDVVTHYTVVPPAPAPTPPTPPTPISGDGLTANYYSGISFSTLKLTRIDSTVNFNWGASMPYGGRRGTFSARWTGQIKADFTENYTFYLTTDDGGRLWVNNVLLVNHWGKSSPVERKSPPIALVAGTKYDIKLEYFENARGRAATILKWGSASLAKEIIPQNNLYSGSTSVPVEEPTTPPLPPPGTPMTGTLPPIESTTVTVTSKTGLWTGISKAGDRKAWDVQAAALGSVSTPPYVATAETAVSDAGDFGQHYAYKNVSAMFMTPPDKALHMRRLMLPLFPKFAPLVAPEPSPAEQKLVPAPRRPLPPTYIDPVDIGRVVQQSQVKYEDGPTRFTLEGDSTGTIYTNAFVNDPSGEWLRLVFQKQAVDGEYKFILGRLACGDDPCALLVSSGSKNLLSRTYDFKLTIWQGPDYRIDPAQISSASVPATKVYEQVYHFEPGENISIYTFAKDKLVLAGGQMFFATVEPPPDFAIAYQGAAPGNVIWSTTSTGIFDQYFVPWTLPPFKGLFAPVFYDGYLGAIGDVGGASSIPTFSFSYMFSVADHIQMEWSEPKSNIIMSRPASSVGAERKFWSGGFNWEGRGYQAAKPYIADWPQYPGYGRWVYNTNDLNEIYSFWDFFAARATHEEPPRGARYTVRWNGGAPQPFRPGRFYGSPEPEADGKIWFSTPVFRFDVPSTPITGHVGVFSAIYVNNLTPGHTLDIYEASVVTPVTIQPMLIPPSTPGVPITFQKTLDTTLSPSFVSTSTGSTTTPTVRWQAKAVQFSPLTGVRGNVSYCIVRGLASSFAQGESFVGSEKPGQIIKVSADGTTVTNPWITLSDSGTVTGIDHQDNGHLYAATTSGNMWRITSAMVATLVSRAPEGLFGAIVMPSDNRYGGLSGKVLSSSASGNLYAFDLESNTFTAYAVGPTFKAFDIVQTNKNLYAIGSNGLYMAAASNFDEAEGELLGISSNGGIWSIGWDGTKAAVAQVASLPGGRGEDILFAQSLAPDADNEVEGAIVCDNEYNATVPLQLTTSGDNFHPRLDIDDFDNVWMTWSSNRDGSEEVYVTRYNSDCGTWNVANMGGSETRITKHGKVGAYGKFPNVSVDPEGEVHLTWQSNETSDHKLDVFYARSTGGGSRFMPVSRITNSPENAMMPDIATSYDNGAKRVTIVWHDDRFGDFEIMSATKIGSAWRSSSQRGGDLRLTGAVGDSLFPRVTADKNNNLRVVWHDGRLGDNKSAIFMATFLASTGKWFSSGQGGKDMLISHSPQNSFFPDVDTDPVGGIGVVWHDDRHAIENPDYHEEVYSLYCLRQGEAVGGPHFQALDPSSYMESPLTSFEIHDCVEGTQIQYTNIPNVCLKINSPGSMFFRAYNEDNVTSQWMPFKAGTDFDTMIAPWELTSGTGKKTVCVQVQDEFNVSYPICQDVTLINVESKFSVNFFSDERLSNPLPTFNGWPITTSGNIFFTVTMDEAQVYPPKFDVITRGSHSIFNQETTPMAASGFSGASQSPDTTTAGKVVTGNGVTGFEANAYRQFKGRIKVYRDDGVFHKDGLARIVIRSGTP